MGNPQEEALRRRKNVVLVTVQNDPESEVVVRLAEHMGMCMILLTQGMGASLDKERRILDRIHRTKRREVWTLEIPGEKTELAIRQSGLGLEIVDHHAYKGGQLDRTRGADGMLLPSSLEQFIQLAGITDDEIRAWGYNPRTIRGIGIYDASVGWGLRAAGYIQAEIRDVLDFRARIMRATNTHFDRDMALARAVWAAREKRSGYWFMMAGFNVAPSIVQAAVEDATEQGHEQDAEPMLIAAPDGMVITVRHVTSEVIAHLNATINGHTFVFGTANCWGVDNGHGDAPHVTLQQVIAALESAPRTAPVSAATA